MRLKYSRTVSVVALAALALGLASGCAPMPEEHGPSPITAPRVQIPDMAESPRGALFDEQQRMRLFEDRSARRQGDLITVIVEEEMSGSRSVGADMFRAAEGDFPTPQFGGEDFDIAGRPMSFEHDSESNFEGGGGADQDTSLSGTITAVVVDTLPNGQMVIQGQKAVTVSQGEEYLTISGIVRPDDVGANNEVSSDKIAAMQVGYTGEGSIDDAAAPGWMSRFFMSR
ncbi:hypothetical protein CKO08_06060 [Halorhodospira halochloris]|nr:flagellar basal body L-ring protein FlgH [Halorhodospira halochloris]MBK1651798.1 hypothetical protein [Halorhodospira halochloris]